MKVAPLLGSQGPWRHQVCNPAWLAGTLAASSVQGHGLPLLRELWPYQSFLEPLVAGDQKAFLASVSL